MKRQIVFLLAASALALSVVPAFAGNRCTTLDFSNALAIDQWTAGFALGDFNGDGNTDIATSGNGPIEIKFGAANHQVAQGSTTTGADISSEDVVATDLNNDGKVDLVAVSSYTNSFAVYIGSGTGSFTFTNRSLTGAKHLVAGDFNHDGNKDIAVISTSSTLSILMGNGTGTLGTAATISLPYFPLVVKSGDVDGDGDDDLVIGYGSGGPASLALFKSNGDGTFASPLSLPLTASANPISAALALADLNGDSRPEIITAYLADATLSVLVNHGDGTFAAVVPYATSTTTNVSIATGDFTGDGSIDVVVSNSQVTLFPGAGDGTLGTGINIGSQISEGNSFVSLAPFDWNGDGRLDLVAGGSTDFNNHIDVLTNQCGISRTTLAADTIVGINQQTTLTATVTGVSGPITGTVTFNEGASVLGTASVQPNGKATLSYAFSSTGNHSITAAYGGDATYDPSTSPAVIVNVTTEIVTVAMTVPSTLEYDTVFYLSPTVTSSVSGPLTTPTFLVVDGVRTANSYYQWSTPLMEIGTHTIRAHYETNGVHPSADSPAYTVVVTKRLPMPYVSVSPRAITAGQSISVSFNYFHQGTQDPHAVLPTSPLTLRYGATLFGTLQTPGVAQDLGTLPAGTYQMTGTTPETDHYLAGRLTITLAVLPNTPLAVSAIGTSPTSASVTWTANGADYYKVMQRGPSPSSNWGLGPSQMFADLMIFESNMTPNSAYAFRVDAYHNGNSTPFASAVDVMSTATFTDDAPVEQTTAVRALHFLELQTATNALRALAGLSPMSFADGAPSVGGFIRASHLNDLRTAINQARVALGAPAIVWSETLTSGFTIIRARHLQELRDALR